MSTINILVSSVLKIAQLQAVAVDRLAFQDAATNLAESGQSRAQVNELMQYLQLPSPKWLSRPVPAATPLLMLTPTGRWQVLRGINSVGHSVSEWWDADC
jgi:hypothetical protein